MRLRPFFSYYGSKYRLAKYYPQPRHKRVIEPFAGSAGYATNYYQADVRLYEICPKVSGIWDYLIRASSREIRALPGNVESIYDLPSRISGEAKDLIGFWLGRCGEYPRDRLSAWGKTYRFSHPSSFWSKMTRNRIALQVDYIRHWKVFNKSYEMIAYAGAATWFVDPPYSSKAGRSYRSGRPDFDHLGDWVLSRFGQVIVCEATGASWLPFCHLLDVPSCKGKGKRNQRSAESVYITHSDRIID